MSAKRLGRFAAGLFVALGLAFGGPILATAAGSGSAQAASPIPVSAFSAEIDWA
jgi:hypothetical protein